MDNRGRFSMFRNQTSYERINRILHRPESKRGLLGSAYDTAWIAAIPSQADPNVTRFPKSYRWLLENQHADGSWGSAIRYEHDRILCTLAVMWALLKFDAAGRERARVEAGVRYLWQHGHHLGREMTEFVATEFLIPTFVERIRKFGIQLPPNLDVFAEKRRKKLEIIPNEMLFSPNTTLAVSLEFLADDVDAASLARAQSPNGSLGCSPSATAYLYEKTGCLKALEYLKSSILDDGSVRVAQPSETYELLWTACHLFFAGVAPSEIISDAGYDVLAGMLQKKGVSFSVDYPNPDSDDTAVAALLVNELGRKANLGVLSQFQNSDGYFTTYHFERGASLSSNIHVLHALVRVPGFPSAPETVERLVRYLRENQREGAFWTDKWHLSPYYATSHALCVFSELPRDLKREVASFVGRSREWLRQTQNADGSWGFCGQPTAEETAYAVIALLCDPESRTPLDLDRCREGVAAMDRLLPSGSADGEPVLPALWIHKTLYHPPVFVQAIIEGARMALERCEAGK